MTHIEGKSSNIGVGGPGEPVVEAEAALSPEALALFSDLFAQMQPEMDGAAETVCRSASSAVVSSVEHSSKPPSIAVTQENSDASAINLDNMANLTELLVAAQQIIGSSITEAEMPTSTIDKSIFTDSPMSEGATIANQLMQQAAAALIERRQATEGSESSVPRPAYNTEALSNPQLATLLYAAEKPVLRQALKQALPFDDAVTAAPEAIIDFDSQTMTSSSLDLPLDEFVPTALKSPLQSSRKGPVPVQLAHIVQGPPQKSGQGPAVSSVIQEVAKYLQGPPQASGKGPVMQEVAKQLQGPQTASGQGLASIQRPPPGDDRLIAKLQMAQPILTKGGATTESTPLDEVALVNGLKTEVGEKSEIKFEIRPEQKLPDGLRNDRMMTPADAMMQKANLAVSQSTSQLNVTPSRTVTPPMMLDLSRQMTAEAQSDSNNPLQQSTTSSASVTQQHGGQSSGNGSGQQGRDSQPVIDTGAKNAGGERVATYRLNVQQNGWADTMVRRLQTSLQNGSGAVRIILEPRNLGRLHVTMGLRDGRAAIRIAADTKQAAGLLRDSRAQLAQMFEHSGLRLTNMQTTTAILNGDSGAMADGGGSMMFADQQTSGQNANKDGKNSEQGNKLLSGSADAGDIEIDTTTALAPGETAVLNVLA